jgi:pilus assembly protein Flp/PilA
VQAITEKACGTQEEIQMVGVFLNAYVAARTAHGTLFARARTERGAILLEYALLIGLIAVVAVVVIAALGGGISGLFRAANTCVGGMNSTSC